MSDSKYPSDQLDQFRIRMPSGMRDKIAEIAKKNCRSMNAEIVARLESSLDADKKFQAISNGDPVTTIVDLAEQATALMAAITAQATELKHDAGPKRVAKGKKKGKP